MFQIKTVSDIHPNEIFLTKEEYKTLKTANKKSKDGRLYIPNKEVAQSLNMKDMINYSIDEYHTLKIEGKYKLEYEQSKSLSRFWTEFRAWVTLCIALFAFILSIISII